VLLPERISAPRVTLRRPRREDAEAVAEAIEETLEPLSEWFQWAQLLRRFADPEDMGDRAVVANLRFDDLHNPVYFIWRGEQLLGEVMLDNPRWESDRALELQVWLRRSAWGHGLATEAARAALTHVFEVEGCRRVEARIESGNRSSRALFTRLGFERSGFRKDHELYVLTAEAFGAGARPLGVVVLSHPECLLHQVGPGHPERPRRLTAVLSGADQVDVTRLGAPRNAQAVELVHGPGYVDALQARLQDREQVALDADTDAGSTSVNAALRGVGGAVAAVDLLIDGRADHAFVATRPPGHHAEPDQVMGFCLFSTAAIAAVHARQARGLRSVVVLDVDIHHGNGTQAALADRPGCLFICVHERLLYPLSGREPDPAPGRLLVDLPPRCDGPTWRQLLRTRVLPLLESAEPDLIIVSLGVDGHALDDLSTARLQNQDYAWLARQVGTLAPTVTILEGGYNLVSLENTTKVYLQTLNSLDYPNRSVVHSMSVSSGTPSDAPLKKSQVHPQAASPRSEP